MKLSIADRISVLNIQPEAGSMSEARLSQQIVEKVKIIEREAKIVGLKLEQTKDLGIKYTWNREKEEQVEIPLFAIEIDFLKQQIKRLDDEKKINPQQLNLFDRILAERAVDSERKERHDIPGRKK